MKPHWVSLDSDDDTIVLDELYRLSGTEEQIIIDNFEVIRRLLRNKNDEVRERTLFVFGIKAPNRELCGDYLKSVFDARPEDWDVIGAGLLALGACNCFSIPKERYKHLLNLLQNKEVNAAIGPLIVAWIRRSIGLTNDNEYLRERLAKLPIGTMEIDTLNDRVAKVISGSSGGKTCGGTQ